MSMGLVSVLNSKLPFKVDFLLALSLTFRLKSIASSLCPNFVAQIVPDKFSRLSISFLRSEKTFSGSLVVVSFKQLFNLFT